MSNKGRKGTVKQPTKSRLRRCFSLWGKSDRDLLKTQLYIWFPCVFQRPRLDALQHAIVGIATRVMSKVNLTTIMTPNLELTDSHDQRTLHRDEIRASMKGEHVEFVSGIVPRSQKQGLSTCTSLSLCETQYEEKLENLNYESKSEGEPGVLIPSFESRSASTHPEREPSCPPTTEIPFHNIKESKLLHEMYDNKRFHVPAWFVRLATSETALQLMPFSLDGSFIQSEELKEMARIAGRLRLEALRLNTSGGKYVHFAIAEECKRDSRPSTKKVLLEKGEELCTTDEYNDTLMEPSTEPLSASDESQVTALFEEERKLSFPYRWKWLKEDCRRQRNQKSRPGLRRRLTQIGLGWRGTRRSILTLALERRKDAQPEGPDLQLQHGYPPYNKVANVARVKKRNTHFSGHANANFSRNNSNGYPRNCTNNHLGMKSIQVQTSSDEADDLEINQKILLTNAKIEAEQDRREQQQMFSNVSLKVYDTPVNMQSPLKPITSKEIQSRSCLRAMNTSTNQMQNYLNIDTEKHRKKAESKPVSIHEKGCPVCLEYKQNKSNSSNADMTNLEEDKTYVDDLSKEQKLCCATGLVSVIHTQTIPVVDLLAKGVSPRKTTSTRKVLKLKDSRTWPSRKGSCRRSRYLSPYKCSSLDCVISNSACTNESCSLIMGEPVKGSAENILPVPYVQKHVLDQSSLPIFFHESEFGEQDEQRNVDKPENLAGVIESIANFVRRQWKNDAFSHIMKSQQFTNHSSDHVKQEKSEKIMTTVQNPLIRLKENSQKYFRTPNQKNESIPYKDQFQYDSIQPQNAEHVSDSKTGIQNRSKYLRDFQITRNVTTQSSKNNGIHRERLITEEIPSQSIKQSVYFQDFQNRRLKRVSHQRKHGSLRKKDELRSVLQKTHAVSSVHSLISETPRLSFQNNNDTPPPVEEESRSPFQDNVMNEIILEDHQAPEPALYSNVTENDSQPKTQSIRSMEIHAAPGNGDQYKNQSTRAIASGSHQASGLVSQTVPNSNPTVIGDQSKNQSIRSVETRTAPDSRRQSNSQSVRSLRINSYPDVMLQGTNVSQTSPTHAAHTQTDAQRASLMLQSIMDALDILISREKAGRTNVHDNTLRELFSQQAFRRSTEADELRRQTQFKTDTSLGSVRTIKRDTHHEVSVPSPTRESYTYRPLQTRTFSRNRGTSYSVNQDKSDTWRNSRRTDPSRAYFSDPKGDPCRTQLSTPCDGLRSLRTQGKTSVPEYARSPLHKSPEVGETLHNSRLFYPMRVNAEDAGTPGKDRPFSETEACALAYINHACNLGPPACFEVAHKSMGCHREADADKCMSGCGVNTSELVEVDHHVQEPGSKDVIEYPCVLKCQVPTSSVEKCFCLTNPSVKVCCEKARCVTRHAECTKTKCSCRKLGSCSKAVQVDLKKSNAPNCKKSVSVCVQKVKTKPVCTTSVQTCLCLCNTLGKCKNGKAMTKTVPEPNTNVCCGLNMTCSACCRCRTNAEVCCKSTVNCERQRGVQTQREDDDTIASTVASCVTLHGEECCVKRMHNKKCQVGQPIICQNIGTKVGSSLTCSKMCSCKPREARSKCVVCKASKRMPSGLSTGMEACMESTPCISYESTFGPPLIESVSDCELPYGASLFLKNVARKKAMDNCCLHRDHCVKKSTSRKLCPQCEPDCRHNNICTDYKPQPCCQGRTEEICCEGLNGDKSVSPVMRIHYKTRRVPATKPDCTSSTSWSDVASPNAILKDKISNLIEQSKEVTKQVQKMKGSFGKNFCRHRPCKVIQCQDDSNENKPHENKNTNAREHEVKAAENKASAEFIFFAGISFTGICLKDNMEGFENFRIICGKMDSSDKSWNKAASWGKDSLVRNRDISYNIRTYEKVSDPRILKLKPSCTGSNVYANGIMKPVNYNTNNYACKNDFDTFRTGEKLKNKLNLYAMQHLSSPGGISNCDKYCSQVAGNFVQLDLNNSNENEGDLEKKEVKKTAGGATVQMQDSKHPRKCLERNQRRYVGHWLHRIVSPHGLRSQKEFTAEPNKKKELLVPPVMVGAGERINQNQRHSIIKQRSTIPKLLQPHQKRNITTAFMTNRYCAKRVDIMHPVKIRNKPSHLLEETGESEDSNASSHGIEELPFDHCSGGVESERGDLNDNDKKQGIEKYPKVEVKAKCKTPKTNKIQPANQFSGQTRVKKQMIPPTYSSESSVVSSDKEMAPTAKPNQGIPLHKKCGYSQLGTVYDSSSSLFCVNKLDDKADRSNVFQSGLKGKRTARFHPVDSFTEKQAPTTSRSNIPQRNSSSVISVNYTITPRINRMRQSEVDKDRLGGIRKNVDGHSKPICPLTFKDLEEKQSRNMREGVQNTVINWWNSPDCLKERAALASTAISKATKDVETEEQETKIMKSKCSIIYQQDKTQLNSSTAREYMAQECQSQCRIVSLQKRKGIMQKGRPIQTTTSSAKTTASNEFSLYYERAYNPTIDKKESTIADITEIDDQESFLETVVSEAHSVSGATGEASCCSIGGNVKVKKNSKTPWFARHLGTAEVVEANELRVVLEGAYVIPSGSWKAGHPSQSTISAGQTNSDRGLDEQLYPTFHNSSSAFSGSGDSQNEHLGTFGLKSLPFRLVLLKSYQEGEPVAVHGTYMRKLISEEGAIKWTVMA